MRPSVYLGTIPLTIRVNHSVLVELIHPKTGTGPAAEACTLAR